MNFLDTQGEITIPTVAGAYHWLKNTHFDPSARPSAEITVNPMNHPRFVVTPETVKLPDGSLVDAHTSHPLAQVLKMARGYRDPVIMVSGALPGNTQIGGGDAGQKAYRADWEEDAMRFAVIGIDGNDGTKSSIGELDFFNHTADAVNGGVVDCLFQNLRIETRWAPMCVSGARSERAGNLRFYDCSFGAHPDVGAFQYGGFGYKWGVRTRLNAELDLRRTDYAPVQEHPVYVDGPRGMTIVDLLNRESTRTSVFIVNRPYDLVYPSDGELAVLEMTREEWLNLQLILYRNGTLTPNTPGVGQVFLHGVETQRLRGDGGSAITIAGHLGDVYIRKPKMVIAEQCHGSIVGWTDHKQEKGVFAYTGPTGRLHSTRGLLIQDAEINCPLMDRPAVAVSGAEKTIITRGNVMAGPQGTYSFDNSFGIGEVGNETHVVDGRSVSLPIGARVINGDVTLTAQTTVSNFHTTPIKGFPIAEG